MSNFTPPDSDILVLGIHALYYLKGNFHCAYLNINWVIQIVSFEGVDITLMADIYISME